MSPAEKPTPETNPDLGDNDAVAVEAPAPEAKTSEEASPTQFQKTTYQKPKRGLLGLFARAHGNPALTDGRALLKEENWVQASYAFKTALAEDNNNIEAWLGLAEAHAEMGDIKNSKLAILFYYKALEQDTFLESAYNEVIKLYHKLGNQKGAHSERKKLLVVRTLKSNPHNGTANNNLGVIQLNQKQFDGAIASFTKAVKSEGVHSVAQLNLAKAWLQKALTEKDEETKLKCRIKAAKEVDAYLANNNNAEGFLLKAKIYLAHGDKKKALEFVERAEQLDSSLKEVFNTKRAIEEAMGNIAEATQAFEQYQSMDKQEKKKK